LVPRSGELKLIQALQKRVLKKTEAYDAEVPDALRNTDEATDEAAQISAKQGKVKELTRALANKINKQDTENQ
jgi:hypothetical protein